MARKHHKIYNLKNNAKSPTFDFVIDCKDGLVPVKIHKGKNNTKVSIKRYMENNNMNRCYIVRDSKFQKEDKIEYIPIYYLFYL